MNNRLIHLVQGLGLTFSKSIQYLFMSLTLLTFIGCTEGRSRSPYSGNIYGGPSPAKGMGGRKQTGPLTNPTTPGSLPVIDPTANKNAPTPDSAQSHQTLNTKASHNSNDSEASGDSKGTPGNNKKVAIECGKKEPSELLACLVKSQTLSTAFSQKDLKDNLLREYTKFRGGDNFDEAFESKIATMTLSDLYQLPINSSKINARVQTVAAHTIDVIEGYLSQKPYYLPVAPTGASFLSDPDLFMKLVIILHHAGLGLAAKSGHKGGHENFSEIFSKNLLTALGFRTEAINLGLALVRNQQVISQGLTGQELDSSGEALSYSTSAAIRTIQDGAQQANINGPLFYRYLLLLYLAEASSDENTRTSELTENDGKLTPKSPRFQEIDSAFSEK